ncbi:hypothetical protein [Ponticoccus alexandrii]|uniref:Adenylosuccinate lyase n=1 Tax=Ponticoccus alexandrii TaxID=1943633 RepID=A0ABX7FB17_9RHOB|nr:hypothetical protein [Ponticoccus alexandrii]QRF67066.1 adenylosuccinate lyase [Ponticoccus alexandrii]
MTIKTLLAATTLTLTPLLAHAECWHDRQAAMSCADGTTYSEDSKSCVPVSS